MPESVSVLESVSGPDSVSVPGTVSMSKSIFLADNELITVPVIIENDDVWYSCCNAALDNTEDQVENETSEEHIIKNENIVDKILEQENTPHNPKTPVKDYSNVKNKAL